MCSHTVAERSNSQPSQSAPNTARRPANALSTVPSTTTPTVSSRRSSLITPKAAPSSGSSFRLSSRSDAHGAGSPRPSTALGSDHGLDDTRPTSTAGGVSMSASKSYDRDSSKTFDRDSSKFHDRDSSKFHDRDSSKAYDRESSKSYDRDSSKSHDRDSDRVRGDGDGDSDSLRTDPVPHFNRSRSARTSDSTGHGLQSDYARRQAHVMSHLGAKEDDATLNWNGARSYSSRRSSSFDVPLDNSLGRSHSFSGLHLEYEDIFCSLDLDTLCCILSAE
jgi:hypothetical protein